ncbi:MAG TPA: hypothetical protein IGS37_00115 [Synechococcales cyanobacterium M55_K2018_004]|nr:hypothetical protein [Synechococcales cyanobacterium M55_K2018_004]
MPTQNQYLILSLFACQSQLTAIAPSPRALQRASHYRFACQSQPTAIAPFTPDAIALP